MAVAFNNADAAVRQAGGSFSASLSVTAGNPNLCAFACVAWDNVAGLTLSAITYDGVDISGNACGVVDNNNKLYAQVFYIINPPTGGKTLAVTVSGANEIYVALPSFYGVHQTTPYRNATNGGGSASAGNPAAGTNYKLTVTSATGDMTLTCLNGGLNNTVTSSQTRSAFSTAGTNSYATDYGTGAATVDHTWSCLGGSLANSAIAIVGFSIQPPSSGTAKTPAFQLQNSGSHF